MEWSTWFFYMIFFLGAYVLGRTDEKYPRNDSIFLAIWIITLIFSLISFIAILIFTEGAILRNTPTVPEGVLF